MKLLYSLYNNIVWRFPRTISQHEVVFVVGAPRSGTTLLQRVLSLHSALFSIEGETGLFTKQNIFDLNRRHFGLSDSIVERLFRDSKDIVDFFENGVQLLYSNQVNPPEVNPNEGNDGQAKPSFTKQQITLC